MTVYFDVTKTSRQGHASGIRRTAQRLGDGLKSALGAGLVPVVWNGRRKTLVTALGGDPVRPDPPDWFLTVEPFAPDERPGFDRFLNDRPCRLAAVFHDAIPMRFPEFTWPRSVARFPAYLKMLSRFDQLFAVSSASTQEILGYLAWLDERELPPVARIHPGADFRDEVRPIPVPGHGASRSILAVGILEPRKNQAVIMEACDALWREGLSFDLQLVGRVNPHFGKPLVAEVKRLRRLGRPVVHLEGVSDDELQMRLRSCRFLVFPSRAEGCGLPILEALWMGAPSLCSALPSHRESAEGGGCFLVEGNDREAWISALRSHLQDDGAIDELARAARARELPTWSAASAEILAAVSGA